MKYKDSGTGCPATCANPLAPKQCDRPNVQGCQCQDGYVLSGNTCVPQQECGCQYKGRYFRVCVFYAFDIYRVILQGSKGKSVKFSGGKTNEILCNVSWRIKRVWWRIVSHIAAYHKQTVR